MAFEQVPQPPNYMLNLPDPSSELLKSAQYATGLQQAQQQAQMFPLQMQQAQQQLQMQQLQMQQQQAMRDAISGMPSNPSPAQIANFATRFPLFAKQMTDAYSMASSQEQKNMISLGSQAHIAVLGGHLDVASDLFHTASVASQNSGDPARATQLQAISDAILKDPKHVNLTLGSFISSVKGPDQYVNDYSQFSKQPYDLNTAKATADKALAQASREPDVINKSLALQSSQIGENNARTRDIVADTALKPQGPNAASMVQSKVTQAGAEAYKADISKADLPPEVAKSISEFNAEAAASNDMARRYGSLADAFKKLQPSSGLFAKIAESGKVVMGRQDDVSRIRMLYDNFRNSGILDRLRKAGRITEAEVDLVGSGYPESTANTALIANQLGKMSELSQRDSELNSLQSKWNTRLRGPNIPSQDVNLGGGYWVKAGDNLVDHMKWGLSNAKSYKRIRILNKSVQGE